MSDLYGEIIDAQQKQGYLGGSSGGGGGNNKKGSASSSGGNAEASYAAQQEKEKELSNLTPMEGFITQKIFPVCSHYHTY